MQKEIQNYQALYKKLNDYIHIDSNTLDSLEKILKIKTINKDEYLSELYDNTRQIGFVIEGLIRVYHLKEDGTEYNKNFFTKNDLFVTSLDEKKDSTVFIQTITKCKIIIFDYSEFTVLSLKHKVLEKVLNKILLDYLNKKQQREIELLSLNAKDRYIQFIHNNPMLSKKLPQYHIASYLGITPTQLSRIKKVYKINICK